MQSERISTHSPKGTTFWVEQRADGEAFGASCNAKPAVQNSATSRHSAKREFARDAWHYTGVGVEAQHLTGQTMASAGRVK